MSSIDFSAVEQGFAKLQFKHNSSMRRRLWRKLGRLLENGVPILTALESIRKRRTEATGKGDPIVVALNDWIAQIKNGGRLSSAILDWVTPQEQMLIAAGEQSGELETALNSTIRVMTAQKQQSSAIVKGIAYPMFLFALAFAVLYLFGFKIVPAFTGSVNNANWTGLAKAMIDVSSFTRDWLFVGLGLFAAMVCSFFIALPRWDGRLRVKLDRYPPFSTYRVMQGAGWLIAFAALVQAGLRIESALEQLNRNASPWLKARITACLRGVRGGHSVGEALVRAGHEFPDREIIDDLGLYSTLSGFDNALRVLGNEWIEDSVSEIQSRMAVVFGLSILLVGSIVLFMVSGMMAMQSQLQLVIRSAM